MRFYTTVLHQHVFSNIIVWVECVFSILLLKLLLKRKILEKVFMQPVVLMKGYWGDTMSISEVPDHRRPGATNNRIALLYYSIILYYMEMLNNLWMLKRLYFVFCSWESKLKLLPNDLEIHNSQIWLVPKIWLRFMICIPSRSRLVEYNQLASKAKRIRLRKYMWTQV